MWQITYIGSHSQVNRGTDLRFGGQGCDMYIWPSNERQKFALCIYLVPIIPGGINICVVSRH